jgi:hypothetical protein
MSDDSVPQKPPGAAKPVPPWVKLLVGIVALLILMFGAWLLFGNGGGELIAVTSPAEQPEPAAEGDPEPAADEQAADEPAAEEEPATGEPESVSVKVSDPAGDNGNDGTGADILAMELLRNEELLTVFLTMAFSPLESSRLWYSYYLEVTVIRLSGLIHTLIWETHAGESRSGELDSAGNADGVGVTVMEGAAKFKVPGGDANDPVTQVDVKALSVVEQGDSVTDDRLGVEISSG